MTTTKDACPPLTPPNSLSCSLLEYTYHTLWREMEDFLKGCMSTTITITRTQKIFFSNCHVLFLWLVPTAGLERENKCSSNCATCIFARVRTLSFGRSEHEVISARSSHHEPTRSPRRKHEHLLDMIAIFLAKRNIYLKLMAWFISSEIICNKFYNFFPIQLKYDTLLLVTIDCFVCFTCFGYSCSEKNIERWFF